MASATVYAGNNFQSVCNRLNGSTLAGGSNTENHLPVGWSSTTDSRWRAIIKFPNISASLPVGARIVKAEVWVKTTGSTVHVSKGSNARMKISRLTQSPAFTGGSGEGWYTNANPAGFSLSSTTAITYAAEGNPGNGVVKKYDITDFVEDWLPSNYFKRDGTPCDSATNNGIEIKSYDENSATRTSEFWSTRGGYEPRLVITYTTEDPPAAATLVAPAAGDQQTAPSQFSFTTPAGDTAVNYRLRIKQADGTLIHEPGWTAFTPGSQVDVAAPDLSAYVGENLYWYIDTQNSINDITKSAERLLYILPIPTATLDHPGAGGRCHVWNLGDLAVWTGSEGKPRVEVGYTHPTGVAAQAIEVRLNGGTAHSFPVQTPSGGTEVLDVDEAVARNTDFTIEVRAQGGAGQWSDWTAPVTARINWGQVVLPWTISDPNASAYATAHAPLAGGARAQIAYAYRVAGGTWYKNPSSLPDDVTSAEMLVRMATSDAAQPPSVADMTVEWQSTPSAQPDFWEAVNADISLDSQVRRFGVHSLKLVTNFATAFSVRLRNTEALVVSPDTQYTMSVYVNTLGAALPGSIYLAYEEHPAGTFKSVNPGNEATYSTTDSTGKGKENWQRLYATITTGPDTTLIKPILVGAPELGDDVEVRVDSFQLEAGSVASSWAPGNLGPAVILDVGGIAIDGQAGGIFRARAAGGEVVTLGNAGLELDGEPYITAAAVPSPSISQAIPVRRVYESGATWTKPANLSHIEVEVVGAGGGGGGADNTASTEGSSGGGGGGGGYAKKILADSVLPASCAVAVGTAGAVGSNTGGDGGSGGTSSFSGTGFTTVQATGGGGGSGDAGGTGRASFAGGSVGNASGGDINLAGEPGWHGERMSLSGVAAATGIQIGRGGQAGGGYGYSGRWDAGGDAYGGTGYGYGGTGSQNHNNGAQHQGGEGGNGVVIVTEYFKPVLS